MGVLGTSQACCRASSTAGAAVGGVGIRGGGALFMRSFSKYSNVGVHHSVLLCCVLGQVLSLHSGKRTRDRCTGCFCRMGWWQCCNKRSIHPPYLRDY
jgi:hypothetical protein